MRKSLLLSIVGSLMVGAFVAGVAVGKGAPEKAKFVAAEEVKWDELPGGAKLGNLHGDYKKTAFGALFKLPAGFTSPMHSHTGTYEAVQISGTSSHWLKGEDGTKAKKMTPGSYWMMQGKAEHVSACAPGNDCVMYIWQKSKFDVIPGKDVGTGVAAAKTAAGSGAAKGSVGGTAAGTAVGSAAKPAGATSTAPAAPAPAKK